MSDAKEELTTENRKRIEEIATQVFESRRALTDSSKGSDKKVSQTPEIKETKIPCDTCGGDYPVGKFVDHRMAEIMKTDRANIEDNKSKIKTLEEKGSEKTHHFDPECTNCKSGVEKLRAKPEKSGGYHF